MGMRLVLLRKPMPLRVFFLLLTVSLGPLLRLDMANTCGIRRHYAAM